MQTRTSRRTAIASLGAGAAGVASLSLLPKAAMAAMSSAAGVVAGGSLEGPNGPIQFSAFGSKLEFDDAPEPVFHGALAWHDAAGLDGAPVTISLVSVKSYGPHDTDTSRLMTGTAAVNGEGEHPFSLRMVDGGEIGFGGDMAHLVVGSAAAEMSGTPAVEADGTFEYDVGGEIVSGNVQTVTLA
jgi:hypothetical protein